RNVGLENAIFDYIAFLDADDYYLPNRFKAERTIFSERPEVDGVYGALGFHYYSEEGKMKFHKAGLSNLTTINGKPASNELFLSLTWLHPEIKGHFHLDTLTIKKSIFKKHAIHFTNLKVHQDTVLQIQLSLICKLVAGV